MAACRPSSFLRLDRRRGGSHKVEFLAVEQLPRHLLAALDADQRELTEVTENLRWEMSPAGRCFPWGVALYVPAGERAYSVHGARNKDKLVAIRLAY